MRTIFYLSIFSVLLFACHQNRYDYLLENNIGEEITIDTLALTIQDRFSPPIGYERIEYDVNSFQKYLSTFPLKPFDAKVYLYNGQLKTNDKVYASVLDLDVGTKDLQQCADAVMRLRAEYLYHQKKYDQIHFNFTNGFRVDYTKWAKGNRLNISGNTVNWYKSKSEDYSYPTFKSYMEMIFSYAGTASLNLELESVKIEDVQVGDVFIKGGSPGHAVIVVDVAKNKETGKKVFMIAQSYMPAQNIHILVNENDNKKSPWYNPDQFDKIYSPEWTFEKSELKRFSEK